MLGLTACAKPPQAANSEGIKLQGNIVLTGSSTVAPLAIEMGKRFEEQHPQVRVDVQTGGSSRGLADTRNGSANIGMVSRSLKPEEGDLTAHAIARDGIAIILHSENPVAELSPEQVVDIYQGQLTQWSDVAGGPASPITVVNKAEGRSTLDVFLKHFDLKNSEIQAQVIIGDNEQGIKTVTGNPNAIGYVSIGAAEHSIGRGEPLKMLPLDGVSPSTTTLQDGTFPLARTLNLVTQGASEPTAQAFLQFAQSPQVQDLIEQQNFVPIESAPLAPSTP